MQQLLLAFQVIVSSALVVVVLLQQGRGADAGASFGGGSSGSLFGARGPASFMSRLTAGLAVLFFANSLGMAYISGRVGERRSVIEQVQSQPEVAGSEQVGAGSDVPILPADGGAVSEDGTANDGGTEERGSQAPVSP